MEPTGCQSPDLGTAVETFVVLAGRARFRQGDEETEASAGDVLVVPSGTPHRFESLGP
jgi:mannose-6-phosphate isomerase-like protein (cupin superfamily)